MKCNSWSSSITLVSSFDSSTCNETTSSTLVYLTGSVLVSWTGSILVSLTSSDLTSSFLPLEFLRFFFFYFFFSFFHSCINLFISSSSPFSTMSSTSISLILISVSPPIWEIFWSNSLLMIFSSEIYFKGSSSFDKGALISSMGISWPGSTISAYQSIFSYVSSLILLIWSVVCW